MERKLAPIVLFTYNRPSHTQKVLDALALNIEAEKSILYIFCDGAKNNASTNEVQKINETYLIATNEKRFNKIYVKKSSVNLGLANSIIEGVSQVINQHGKAIILEDDLVTSPYFLKYMNDALPIYELENKVACISAYVYPIKKTWNGTFFIQGADCWGWATWKRAWELFEPDGQKLLSKIESEKLSKDFDFENTYPYTEMLKHQISGKNDSWAIRWYASAFLKNMFCLYPATSLVQNIGNDGTGTHSGNSDKWKVKLSNTSIDIKKIKVEQNLKAYLLFQSYFKTLQPSIIEKIKSVMQKLVR